MAQAPPSCDATVTTASMRTCADQRYAVAAAALNSTYAKLMQQLPAASKRRLTIAQHAWLRYRDTNADFVAQNADGTIAALLRTATLAAMTEARTAELQKELQ